MANLKLDYWHGDAELGLAHAYLLPVLKEALNTYRPQRVFELGCGNGAVAHWLQLRGVHVTGVDTSATGIDLARKAYPDVNLVEGSAYDDLAEIYGHFPVVISLEVVEHLHLPRKFAQAVFDLLEPGGVAVISTPYHGYLKNLALAVSGRLDAHFTALWDGGHIKFWSEATLRALLVETGFERIVFRRVGRIPALAKSMVAIAAKPRS